MLSRILAGVRRQHARPVSDRLCGAEFRAFPAGQGQTVLCATATAAARIVPAAVADFLTSCRSSLAPMEEHLARWSRGDAEAGDGAVRAVAELAPWLLREGFLVSPDTLFQVARGSAPPRDRASITTLGLVTCDRMESLAEAVATHLDTARRWGRSVDLVVVDDTSSPVARGETRARLATFPAPGGASLWYAGREEKERFAAALARDTGVEADLVAFALFDPDACGRSVGANRNALLLHTVGELVFSADDDVRSRVAEVPGTSGGLALVSMGDPTEFRFFADRRAALAAAPFVDADPLAAHERLLGATLAACLAAEPGPGSLDLREAGPGLLTTVLRGRGRVRVTLSGLVGDSGIGSADALLSLVGPSRERLLASEATYRAASIGREVFRAVPRPTVGEVTLCMAPAIGLDNRDLLPPFFPVRRNQDGLFGLTARLASDDMLTGLLPHALLHAPPEPRRFPPDEIWAGAAAFHIADVVMDALVSLLPVHAPPDQERLSAMGRRLREIASLPAGDFREHVEAGRCYRLGRRAAALEQLLHEHDDRPAYWARDVHRQLGALRQAALRDDADVPVDLAEGRDPAAARGLTRRLVLRYGQLLEAWPALVDGARRLRARGVRVAEPVGGRRP